MQTATLIVPVDNELHLETKEGQVVVSSRHVSERFGKRHDNVIRDIEGLLKNEETTKAYFILSNYQHPQNKQWYPEYLLTRDGLTLLVMGFTGQEALQWKLRYIEAFNKMEQVLRNNPLLKYNQELEELDKVAKVIDLSKKDKLIAVVSILQKHNMPTLGLEELIIYKHPKEAEHKQNKDDAINYICEHNPAGFPLKEYYKNYLVYCTNDGHKSMGKVQFCKVVRQLGYDSKAKRVDDEVCKVWFEKE